VDVLVDRLSLSGEGEIIIIEGYGPQVMPPDWNPDDYKYRLTVTGKIQPNGAIEGRAQIQAINAISAVNNGNGSFTGGLNPVSGIGSGKMHMGEYRFTWTALYSERN